MHDKLENNIWKYFAYLLTQRRNVMPLVSLFFLTLPNTTAQQIGVFTAAGALASFLFEMPSGYLADKIGHKRTLVLAKLFMFASTLCFVFAGSLAWFIVASILLALGFAFQSGTDDTFFHDTLVALKRESEFAKLSSKISGGVSLVSAFIIIGLPFFTEISIRAPFVVMLGIDIIGIFVALSLVSPPQEQEIETVDARSFWSVVRTAAAPGFFPAAAFFGAIMGFLIADTNYRFPYLESLGYPIVLIGFVMGLSRFFWFLFSYKTGWLESLGLRRLFFSSVVLFPLFYILVAWLDNPYVIGFLYSILVGYFWVLHHVVKHFFLQQFVTTKRHKATMLSVKAQISHVFETVVAFSIGFVMQRSYELGFAVLGVVLFAILATLYRHMSRQDYLTQ